jgi:hypothetical protein
METKDLRLAVLIDADNISYSNIKGMMKEITKYGIPTFKRIYGDWTKPNLTGWKNVLLENAISPVQQYSYTSGKNSSDSALIIDAMDILYTGRVDGFCIVSSDSDFTRLAIRLREAGMKVFGMGEKKTPAPFITSCDKFIYIEILEREVEAPSKNKNTSKINPVKETKSVSNSVSSVDADLINLISESIADIAEDDEWIPLASLGQFVLKKKPDFDPRNYGYKKLLDLIKSTGKFAIDARPSGKNNVSHFFIKAK